MILHRTKGRTSQYLVINARTGDVKSDAVVFFPAETYEGVLALERLIKEHVTGFDSDTPHHELTAWLEQLKRTWEDIRNAEAYGSPH